MPIQMTITAMKIPMKRNISIASQIGEVVLLFLAVSNVLWSCSLFFRNVIMAEINAIIAVSSAINLVDISIVSGIKLLSKGDKHG